MADHFAPEDVADEEPVDRRLSRTLTQRYDMHSLRALQDLEVIIYADLCKLCKCEEDDLPSEIDLLEVYNAKEDNRAKLLTEMLKGVEKTAGCMKNFIDGLLVKLKDIEEFCAIAKAAEDEKKEFKMNSGSTKKKNPLHN